MKYSSVRAATTTSILGALLLAPCSCRKSAETVTHLAPGPPPREKWVITASGTQEDIYAAPLAADGKPETRWSSPPTENQWLQVDFTRSSTIAGASILWENAYSSVYRIEVSDDAASWRTIHSNRRADGKTDLVFFHPVTARYVRVFGEKRATGWGHSIREIDFRGPEAAVKASASGAGSEHLVDGETTTVWTAPDNGDSVIDLDLAAPVAMGGLRLDWGEGAHPQGTELFVSADGKSYVKAAEVRDSTGKFDLLMLPATTTRYLRLNLSSNSESKPVVCREISLRGPDEAVTPLAEYQLAAEKAPEGFYPDSLLARQVYWTLSGLPADTVESALDEYGTLETRAGGFTVTPFILTGKKVVTRAQTDSITQSLVNGHLPLPSVTWQTADFQLETRVLTDGKPGAAVTWAAYRLTNRSAESRSGRFALAVRPLQVNPPWQYGGLSPIRSLAFTPAGATVNDQPGLWFATPPATAGAVPFASGDIARFLTRGKLPDASSARSDDGRVSGAATWDFSLAPGATTETVIAVPLHANSKLAGDPTDFTARLAAATAFWSERLDRVDIDLPERATADTLKSQIAYILINSDGVAIQPGSRNYKRCWIRDGALTAAAMLGMGLTTEVRDYLDWYAARVQPDGWVPPVLNPDGSINQGFGWNNEYDSQGEFVFGIMEYYRFTRDREFLAKHFDAIVRALRFTEKLRARTLDPDHMAGEVARERFVGILPKSVSHEGYEPPMHSYWDNFFALKGWSDGLEAARVLGRDDIAAYAERNLTELRESVRKSIALTIRHCQIRWIPGCAEKGDPDPTSTTIAFFPCRQTDILPQDILRAGYESYWNEVVSRRQPGWNGIFTPYEVRSIGAFADLGWTERAGQLNTEMLRYRRPAAWNQWAEVVHSDARLPIYLGDMPHTWVGSGYVNAIRCLLVSERGGALVLFQGAPASWFEGSGVSLAGLPTHFGPLGVTASLHEMTWQVNFTRKVAPPDGILLGLPLLGKPRVVTVDGAPHTDFDASLIRLPVGAGKVVIQW